MCKVINLMDYVNARKQIKLDALSINHVIQPNHITGVELVPYMSKPAVLIRANGKEYVWMITNGINIYIMNGILKDLKLDVNVEFKSYTQYGYLLMEIDEMLKQQTS